jgi:hypothetical protein
MYPCSILNSIYINQFNKIFLVSRFNFYIIGRCGVWRALMSNAEGLSDKKEFKNLKKTDYSTPKQEPLQIFNCSVEPLISYCLPYSTQLKGLGHKIKWI